MALRSLCSGGRGFVVFGFNRHSRFRMFFSRKAWSLDPTTPVADHASRTPSCSAPISFALVKSVQVRFTLVKTTPFKIAPVKSIPVRSFPVRSMPARFAPGPIKRALASATSTSTSTTGVSEMTTHPAGSATGVPNPMVNSLS